MLKLTTFSIIIVTFLCLDDYQDAMGMLSEAENASNWESEVENRLTLSSSEDDDRQSQTLLRDISSSSC